MPIFPSSTPPLAWLALKPQAAAAQTLKKPPLTRRNPPCYHPAMGSESKNQFSFTRRAQSTWLAKKPISCYETRQRFSWIYLRFR